jgi:hypothetical protein
MNLLLEQHQREALPRIATLRRLLDEHRAAVVPWGSPEVQATWERLEPFLGEIFTTGDSA